MVNKAVVKTHKIKLIATPDLMNDEMVALTSAGAAGFMLKEGEVIGEVELDLDENDKILTRRIMLKNGTVISDDEIILGK